MCEEWSACPQQLRNVYMRANEAELTSSENIFPKICLFPHTKKWATACNAEQAPVVVCVRACVSVCVRALLLSLSCAPPFHARLGSHAAGSPGRRELCGLCPLLNIYRCAREKEENQIFIFFSLPDSPTKHSTSPPSSFLTLTFDENAKSSAGTSHRHCNFRAAVLTLSFQSSGV